jgi:hypothetical protein
VARAHAGFAAHADQSRQLSQLRTKPRASLWDSGTSARSGNQSQPIGYDGVVCIMTGENNAFAAAMETGFSASG